MSSTTESKPNKQIRASTFDVSPSVRRFIADSEGNLDENKTVAALSQTHNTNKYLWTGSFVLVGVVFLLIAANIGISVVVARLTRQINVDPVTGMASVPGSEDVVMKTSEARYKEEDFNFHNVLIDRLSAVKTVEFSDGHISFDVKGYARMSNETILLVEGGSLVFDVNGFKNITGDELTRLFSSINDDMKSSDPDGRKLGFMDHLNAQMATIQSTVDAAFVCSACGGLSVPEVEEMSGLFPPYNINPSDFDDAVCCYDGHWDGGMEGMCFCPETPFAYYDANYKATLARIQASINW